MTVDTPIMIEENISLLQHQTHRNTLHANKVNAASSHVRVYCHAKYRVCFVYGAEDMHGPAELSTCNYSLPGESISCGGEL